MNEQISQIYQQLTGHTYDEARLFFQQLIIKNPDTGNLYFQTFGVPNIIERPGLPYERFTCYEELLTILQAEDSKKFFQLHKGTPYYFLAWLSFDIANYERAVYYLDSALCEDQKNFPKKWLTTPGTQAVLLQVEKSGPVKRVVEKVRGEFENQIKRFNLNTHSNLSVDNLVLNLLNDLCNPQSKKQTHSILTAIYTFLYVYEDIRKLILLGNSVGSLEPLLSHLFKGGLIFESLLKHVYSDQILKKFKGFATLEKVLKLEIIKEDFDLKGEINISATSVDALMRDVSSNSIRASFVTTGRVRNFSGHDLARESALNDIDIYESIFKQISNSLFFILNKHYL